MPSLKGINLATKLQAVSTVYNYLVSFIWGCSSDQAPLLLLLCSCYFLVLITVYTLILPLKSRWCVYVYHSLLASKIRKLTVTQCFGKHIC